MTQRGADRSGPTDGLDYILVGYAGTPPDPNSPPDPNKIAFVATIRNDGQYFIRIDPAKASCSVGDVNGH